MNEKSCMVCGDLERDAGYGQQAIKDGETEVREALGIRR